MGIIRDSFIIFKNWAEAINALPEENQLETYKALIEYGLHGQMPQDISPVSKAMLISFSVGMENSIAKYNASVENGKLGGRPPKDKNLNKPNENLDKPNKTQENLDEPNPNLNVNVNDNVYVNVNDNVNNINNITSNKLSTPKQSKLDKKGVCNNARARVRTTPTFIKPTIEEVQKYCDERKNNVNAEKFWNFYESKGWFVGKSKMKNWKAAVITWEQEDKEKSNSPGNFKERMKKISSILEGVEFEKG